MLLIMKNLRPPSFPREHGAWGILFGAFFSIFAFTGKIEISQLLLLFSFVIFYIARSSFLRIIRGKYTRQDIWWFLSLGMSGWLLLLLCAFLSNYPTIIPASLILLPFLFTEIFMLRKRNIPHSAPIYWALSA